MTPHAIPEAPAPTPDLSRTSASSPASARCQAVESPWTPAPTITCRAESGSAAIPLVIRRFPALEHGGLPVPADDLRVLNPRPELGLGELGVGLLQPDSVGVAGSEVGDQDL